MRKVEKGVVETLFGGLTRPGFDRAERLVREAKSPEELAKSAHAAMESVEANYRHARESHDRRVAHNQQPETAKLALERTKRLSERVAGAALERAAEIQARRDDDPTARDAFEEGRKRVSEALKRRAASGATYCDLTEAFVEWADLNGTDTIRPTWPDADRESDPEPTAPSSAAKVRDHLKRVQSIAAKVRRTAADPNGGPAAACARRAAEAFEATNVEEIDVEKLYRDHHAIRSYWARATGDVGRALAQARVETHPPFKKASEELDDIRQGWHQETCLPLARRLAASIADKQARERLDAAIEYAAAIELEIEPDFAASRDPNASRKTRLPA